MEFHCNYNVRHSLGKGEVVSSILTGSTRKALKSRAFCGAHFSISAKTNGTKQELHDWSRGKSVECDRFLFSQSQANARDEAMPMKGPQGQGKAERVSRLVIGRTVAASRGAYSPALITNPSAPHDAQACASGAELERRFSSA